MPRIDAPARHRRSRRPRQREERSRVRRQRPVPVLVLGLEGGTDHTGRSRMDEDVERPELGDFLRDAGRGDVPAHENRLCAERSQLRGGLLGGRVAAHVADRHTRRAERREAERDRLADAARPAGDEDGRALEAHSALGSGSYAGAEDGIVSHPIRLNGSRSPLSAREDACPRRSRSSIFSSPYLRVG